MWILPKNLHTSHSAQDTRESISDSDALSVMCEQSLMWRSKPSPLKTWSRRLKGDCSTWRLFGRILKAFLGQSFVKEWTFSVEASLVNHLVSQDNTQETKTPATSGRTSCEESENWDDLPLFSWRMSKASLAADSRVINGPTLKTRPFCSMSSEVWRGWVTARRREYSARVKLAPPIDVRESLSWACAPISGNQDAILFQGCLESQDGVQEWNTPRAAISNAPVGGGDPAKPNYWSRLENQVQSTPRQEVRNSSSGSRQESLPKINPRWVETLMGLRVGWTMPSCVDPWTIVDTNYNSSEMELYPTPQSAPLESCGAQ